MVSQYTILCPAYSQMQALGVCVLAIMQLKHASSDQHWKSKQAGQQRSVAPCGTDVVSRTRCVWWGWGWGWGGWGLGGGGQDNPLTPPPTPPPPPPPPI